MTQTKPNPGNKSEDGWREWSRFVLKELERLNDKMEDLGKEQAQGRNLLAELKRLNQKVGELGEKQAQIRTEIATLKVKSGLWGAAGAAVPVALMLVYDLLK